MEHTKLPWNFREDDFTIRSQDFKSCNQMGDYKGCIIADLKPAVGASSEETLPITLQVRSHCVEEALSNARLIAAAPELLEELKNMIHAYVNLLEIGHDRISALGGVCDPVDAMEQKDQNLNKAKEVIAKAEGR